MGIRLQIRKRLKRERSNDSYKLIEIRERSRDRYPHFCITDIFQ